MDHNLSCSIAEHGLIGNTRTAALISRYGSLDWCCFPHFDSPSIFASVLDPIQGGNFTITCGEESYNYQAYIEDTNVLKTIFRTTQSEVALIDCLPVDSEKNKLGELWPMHEILRIVEGVSGETKMMMSFTPRSDYGMKNISISRTGKLGFRCDLGNASLYLHHELSDNQVILNSTNNAVSAHFTLKAGERIAFSLIYSETAPAVIPPLKLHALDRLRRTIDYWRSWISQCQYQGEYLAEVKGVLWP